MTSVLNRSQNTESIIGGVLDSIIDAGANMMVPIVLKHIFQWDLSGYMFLWDQ